MQIETYQDALDYLFSYVDFSLTHQEQIAPERFELARMFDLMALLGNPQDSFPSIHIAGTKGKGSVAAHCDAALRAAGLTTGLYTSPHLQDFRERIQVNSQPIPQADFIAGMRALQAVAPRLPGLTSYELQTALAFWYFEQAGVACAVVEVGMGGRLDSTNILTPLVSVIANISYDHTAILGDTLALIAAEKGGIIKPGVPVVSAPQEDEALQVLRRIAAEKDSPLILVGEQYQVTPLSASLEGQTFRMLPSKGIPVELTTRLLGPHQVENASAAFAALQAAADRGLALPLEAIREGFATVRWPGRFEVFPGQPQMVFDGAHNRHSARRLAQTIRQFYPEQKPVVVFGASEDKDIAGMFAELLPLASGLVLVQAGHPRAADAAHLAELASGYALSAGVAVEPGQALAQACAAAGPDGLVLVTGSLYLVGELRRDLD
jgi:dihydrofolate synthase/folylpolyglutamate synthase